MAAVLKQAPAIALPALPWSPDALEPMISARTIVIHHGRHHRAYVDKLNEVITGTDFAGMSLEDIVRATAPRPGGPAQPTIFNNAAQAWNHGFYWTSLTPRRTAPSAALARRLDSDLGGLDAAKDALREAAMGQFGSGWAWLILDGAKLKVEATANAETPTARGATCLLAIDVWEHAYYLDRENKRDAYVDVVVDRLLDWDQASRLLADA